MEHQLIFWTITEDWSTHGKKPDVMDWMFSTWKEKHRGVAGSAFPLNEQTVMVSQIIIFQSYFFTSHYVLCLFESVKMMLKIWPDVPRHFCLQENDVFHHLSHCKVDVRGGGVLHGPQSSKLKSRVDLSKQMLVKSQQDGTSIQARVSTFMLWTYLLQRGQ